MKRCLKCRLLKHESAFHKKADTKEMMQEYTAYANAYNQDSHRTRPL